MPPSSEHRLRLLRLRCPETFFFLSEIFESFWPPVDSTDKILIEQGMWSLELWWSIFSKMF
jgi:hypothetical protein